MRKRRHSRPMGRFVEVLESRQLLSGAQIDYTNFSSTAGLVTNGFGSAPTTTNNTLELTDGGPDEARSALYGTKVPIDTFTAHFSFQVGVGQPGVDGTSEADGFTFVIDNGTTSDVGASGFDLAYSSGTFGSQSVALEFNTYNLGAFGSTFAFTSGGVGPSSTNDVSPLDYHSGDTIAATVTYDGTNLAISLVDTTASTSYATSEAINLASVLGGHTAFVGFTGATGSDDSVQEINNFDFTGTGVAPTITTAAAVSPVVVTGTKAHLSVAAVSNTGGTLSYNWTLLHKPSGAAVPTLKPNDSGSANDTIAHFFKAGTYIFRVTVTDSNGGTAVSDVAVFVEQTPTQIKMQPHKAQIVKGTTEQYSAAMYDQFGHALEVQPAFTFAIVTGAGSIDASTGLFSASGSIGHLLVSASADDLTGEAGATVIS